LTPLEIGELDSDFDFMKGRTFWLFMCPGFRRKPSEVRLARILGDALIDERSRMVEFIFATLRSFPGLSRMTPSFRRGNQNFALMVDWQIVDVRISSPLTRRRFAGLIFDNTVGEF
jgi:hypothetical protein